jgi:hypothetical protein
MSADAPTLPLIRRATTSDVPRLGRLGALLVEAHHERASSRKPLGRGDRSDYSLWDGEL